MTRDKTLNERFRDAARRLHGKDGECEIDHDAFVSHSEDGGAYVQAWVWVYNDDINASGKEG